MLLLDIFRFSFLRFFAYPFEIAAELARTTIELVFLILFWSIVIQHSQYAISLNQIIAYFLVASGIKELVMAQFGDYGGLIGRLIRTGEISNYLIKPTSVLASLYAITIGRSGITMIMAVLMIIIGIILQPPSSILSIFLFVAFFIFSWSICFAYNIIEGTIFFYIPDSQGLRGSMGHIVGIFSGMMIPLYLLPSSIYTIVKFSPFPSMIYLPTHALTITELSNDTMLSLAVSLFWSVVLLVTAHFFWKRSTKIYESTGI